MLQRRLELHVPWSRCTARPLGVINTVLRSAGPGWLGSQGAAKLIACTYDTGLGVAFGGLAALGD